MRACGKMGVGCKERYVGEGHEHEERRKWCSGNDGCDDSPRRNSLNQLGLRPSSCARVDDVRNMRARNERNLITEFLQYVNARVFWGGVSVEAPLGLADGYGTRLVESRSIRTDGCC